MSRPLPPYLLSDIQRVSDHLDRLDVPVSAFLIHPLDMMTWEERLANAIAYRSIRNRLRRGWAEVKDRLLHAWRALRGQDCDSW